MAYRKQGKVRLHHRGGDSTHHGGYEYRRIAHIGQGMVNKTIATIAHTRTLNQFTARLFG